jgi:hypothetical protein
MANFCSCGHCENIKKPMERTSFAHFRYSGFSIIRTRGKHTEPWKKLVLLLFQNGHSFHWFDRSICQTLVRIGCALFQNGRRFHWLEPISILKPGKDRFCSFLKWSPFHLLEPVSIPNRVKNRFCSVASGRHFHWLEPANITNPCKNRFLFLFKMADFLLRRTR